MDLSEIRKKSKKNKKEEKEAKQSVLVVEQSLSAKKDKEEEENIIQEKTQNDVKAPVEEIAFPNISADISYEEEVKGEIIEDEKYLNLLLFGIGSEDFTFDVNYVKEIIRFKEITNIPSSQEFLKGIVSLRGLMIPVIDLKNLLNLGVMDVTGKTRIIIISSENGKKFGLVVDNVEKVIEITILSIEIPTTTIASVENDYVKGVARKGGKLITILDLDKILGML